MIGAIWLRDNKETNKDKVARLFNKRTGVVYQNWIQAWGVSLQLKKAEIKRLTTSLKNILPLFFLILIGCSDSDFRLHPVDNHQYSSDESFSQVFYFDSDPRLDVDDNGFYHLTIDMSNWQTLHRLSGTIIDSATVQPVVSCRVEWTSSHYWNLGDTLGYWVRQGLTDDLVWVSYDTSYIIGFDGQMVPTINPASYSNGEGAVNAMIAPVQSMIGDTMTIWYSWGGWYTNWETDSLKIILE